MSHKKVIVPLTSGMVGASPESLLTYANGNLLTNAQVVTIFWGAAWTKPAQSGLVTQINDFFHYILSSSLIDLLKEYSVPGQDIGHGTWIGTFTETGSEPGGTTKKITDADIQTQLQTWITNGDVPATNSNTLYFVYLPPDVKVTGPSTAGDSCTDFCGYHWFISGTPEVYYAVMPFPSCSGCLGSLTQIQALTSTSSHELCEAITDPHPWTGWNSTSGEIGDICAWQTQEIGGYTVQKEWSNQDGACVVELGENIPRNCTVITDRSKFGKDEIDALLNLSGTAAFESAFYVAVDGFNPSELGITSASLSGIPDILPSVNFSPNISGMSITPTALLAEDSSLPFYPQRFTWVYRITFTDDSGFPTNPGDVIPVTLTASIAGLSGSANIQLVDEPNPYELDGSTSWLSTDLRVFQINAGDSRFAVSMGNAPTDAPNFIQQVLTNLHSGNTGGESFDDISTDEDTSKLELSEQVNGVSVFNFAVAKVRFRSLVADANNVRVFFRLFPVSTTSTGYDLTSTYLRGGQAGVIIPLLGVVGGEIACIPCFAAARVDSSSQSMNDQTDPPNVQMISHDGSGNEVVAYFGCWLDINQPSQRQFPVFPSPVDGPFPSGRQTIQELIRSAHQCLVSEISMDGVTLISAGDTPGMSDKLAQRNLSIVASDNPGSPASHQIPNTFEIKPSYQNPKIGTTPDELLIDWGNTPAGSQATIYIPGANPAQILAMANNMYSTHMLTLLDADTLQCPAGGITYIPIPSGSRTNYAGLLTVDLPASVRKGQSFKIVVRQITNAFGKKIVPPPPPPQIGAKKKIVARGFVPEGSTIRWRKVLGSFQITIPVLTKEVMLIPEERLLSVLRWILKSIPQSNRWFPVFSKYVGQIADRVRALGGDPDKILPSPSGEWGGGKQGGEYCYTGKVCEVIYDCFGDFEGFVLKTCADEYVFKSREKAIGEIVLRACKERFRLTVCVDKEHRKRICKVIAEC